MVSNSVVVLYMMYVCMYVCTYKVLYIFCMCMHYIRTYVPIYSLLTVRMYVSLLLLFIYLFFRLVRIS